jgi:hypothetical protein
MKSILFLTIFMTLWSCQNNVLKNNINKNTIFEITRDSCNQIASEISYYDSQQRFRTVDFVEDIDTFRIVPDTLGEGFYVYLQKKIGLNCWSMIDTFICKQDGIYLEDLNGDGLTDICNVLNLTDEIYLYNPKEKEFTHKIETGQGIIYLPNNVKYDFYSYNSHSDSLESRLFRFENYDINYYATLKVKYKGHLEDNELEKIELYTKNKDKQSLLKEWSQKAFPEFIKNNGAYEYFETREFIKAYWGKNWKNFIPN